MARKTIEPKVTFVGEPNAVLLYQSLAESYSRRYGVDIRLARVRNKSTGDVKWEAVKA